MNIKIALAHVADSRHDFYNKREAICQEEIAALHWLRQSNVQIVESPALRTVEAIQTFAREAQQFAAQALIIHVPIWADPILTVKLHNYLDLPVLLVGNRRPDSSSIVGMLGAGGALDQIGATHVRIFDHTQPTNQKKVIAFVRAAATRATLRGQTLGLFGGRSLGIFTASADVAQWQALFGVDIEYIDQVEIVRVAEQLDSDTVESHQQWLTEQVGQVQYGGIFTNKGLERQVRSYIATRQLQQQHNLDFIGVKCQRELSDGYASQCVAHMLMNGTLDANGGKRPIIHACESDADGALTMQILHLLSVGQPSALLDIRWLEDQTGFLTLANCGAMAASFFASPTDPSGLSAVSIVPHVFGEGGGGALPGVVPPQPVTLARLCRRSGQYWMALVRGEAQPATAIDLQRTTSAFPQAIIKSAAGYDFLEQFGSNHIHMVTGDYIEEVMAFCRLTNIPYELWA